MFLCGYHSTELEGFVYQVGFNRPILPRMYHPGLRFVGQIRIYRATLVANYLGEDDHDIGCEDFGTINKNTIVMVYFDLKY